MDESKAPPSVKRAVSASELAQMGVCERLVVFEQRYGKRRNLARLHALQRGLDAHQRFYRDGHVDTATIGHRPMPTVVARVGHRVASALFRLPVVRVGMPAMRVTWRLLRRFATLWAGAEGRDDGT